MHEYLSVSEPDRREKSLSFLLIPPNSFPRIMMVLQRSNSKRVLLEGKKDSVWECCLGVRVSGALGSCSFPASQLLNFGQELTLQGILWLMLMPRRCCLLREGGQGDKATTAPRNQTPLFHIPAASVKIILFL